MWFGIVQFLNRNIQACESIKKASNTETAGAWFVQTTKSLFNESIKEASDTPDSSLPRLIVIIMRLFTAHYASLDNNNEKRGEI